MEKAEHHVQPNDQLKTIHYHLQLGCTTNTSQGNQISYEWTQIQWLQL